MSETPPSAIPSNPPTESVQSAGQVSIPSESPTEPIPDALQQRSQQIDPTGRKVGNRVKNGGSRPNAGLQKGTQLASKRTYDPHALAEVVANKVIQGGKIVPTPQTGPISEGDKQLLARIAGVSVETFNEMFSHDLREISVLATARIKEKLLNDEFKTGELAFVMTSATDKRALLDGSRALQNASVNIIVNQFGPNPKDQLLTELDGMTNVTPSKLSGLAVGIDSSSSLVKVS